MKKMNPVVGVAVAAAVSVLGALAPAAQAAPPDVDNAMLLIRGACTMANAALDIKPTPEGRLELRITLPNGQRRVVTLVHRDVERFMDVATNAMTAAPMQVGACMDPYISEVTNTLSQLPERPSAPPPAPYTPPSLPAPSVMPSPPPPAMAPAPARPALPPTGELPVGVVNGTAPAAPVASATGDRVTVSVQRCRGADRTHVICEVKVHNRLAQDAKVAVAADESILRGEEGTLSKLYSIRMGENMLYKSGADHEIRFDLLADAAPVLQFHFHSVTEGLLSIKRLEIRIGARVGTDGEKQTFTFANIPIQGR